MVIKTYKRVIKLIFHKAGAWSQDFRSPKNISVRTWVKFNYLICDDLNS